MSDRDTSSTALASKLPEATELVFALCHEIGNLVAAVQLEADLLDEAESPRGLAAGAVKIEDLCGQVGGLLSQVRPLLSEGFGTGELVDPEAIVAAASAELEWRGSGHVELSATAERGLALLDIDPDSLRDLLLALVSAALDPGLDVRRVSLTAVARSGGVAFVVVADGQAEEALRDFHNAARCGRPLICGVAENLLRRRGGRVTSAREGERTRIEFWLPAAQR